MAAVAATLVGAGASLIGEYLRKKSKSSESIVGSDLESRVRSLTESLNTSTFMIAEIQEEIEKRHELVTKLQKDTEHYETLSKLKEKEAEAVAQLLQGIVNQNSSRSFYKGVLANFVFFVLGVGASYAIAQFM